MWFEDFQIIIISNFCFAESNLIISGKMSADAKRQDEPLDGTCDGVDIFKITVGKEWTPLRVSIEDFRQKNADRLKELREKAYSDYRERVIKICTRRKITDPEVQERIIAGTLRIHSKVISEKSLDLTDFLEVGDSIGADDSEEDCSFSLINAPMMRDGEKNKRQA